MSTETPAYLIGNFTVTDAALMARYSQQATPLMQQFGGKVVLADQALSPEEGQAGEALVIIEFPSLQAARDFYHAPAYAAMRDLRIKATTGGFLALSEGLPVPL